MTIPVLTAAREGKVSILDYLNDRLFAMPGAPPVYFLTAEMWGRLVTEVWTKTGIDITNKGTCSRFLIRGGEVRNAGTDDQKAVNAANLMVADPSEFQHQREVLRVH